MLLESEVCDGWLQHCPTRARHAAGTKGQGQGAQHKGCLGSPGKLAPAVPAYRVTGAPAVVVPAPHSHCAAPLSVRLLLPLSLCLRRRRLRLPLLRCRCLLLRRRRLGRGTGFTAATLVGEGVVIGVGLAADAAAAQHLNASQALKKQKPHQGQSKQARLADNRAA